jgi:proliferating cell nuclear antigen
MKLTLADSKYLKDSISIISDLVTEARFKITSDAIELVAMDPANVAMVIFKLLSSTFTEYEVKEPVDIAINLGNMKQFLKRAKPDDVVTLELEKDSKLKIVLKGKSTRTFSLPILDLEEKEQKIPDLSFAAKITMPSSAFNECVEDADLVADALSLMAEKGKFKVKAEGDLSKAEIDIAGDDENKIAVEGSDKIKAKYSIEYLKKMIGGAKIADTVTVNFNTDYPLKLEYRVVDRVQLAFILAPRVEND